MRVPLPTIACRCNANFLVIECKKDDLTVYVSCFGDAWFRGLLYCPPSYVREIEAFSMIAFLISAMILTQRPKITAMVSESSSSLEKTNVMQKTRIQIILP